MRAEEPTARLLVSCPDQRGLVAVVSDFVYRHGGDIVHAEQHTDESAGVFFQRVEFRTADLDLGRHELPAAFAPIAQRLGMQVQVRWSDERRPVAILASRQPHCLYDLLARWQTGEMPGSLALVISNHPDHAELVAHFGVAYHHLPVSRANRADQERAMLGLLSEAGVELVVLARYMQILSPAVIEAYPSRIINIHHSFLPAFVGSRPYHQAYERGVKVIGVTAHYATVELDQGPIIDQDVCRVSHRHDVDDLVRAGRDLETVVLARAVRYHLTDRILVSGNKTVVFN